MLSTLVMTVIGRDRPGLVTTLAASVADNGGNWLSSRMAHLGGQFAGLLHVEISSERVDALKAALKLLENQGLRIIVHQEDEAAPVDSGTPAQLDLVGQDQPGILRQITGVLAKHHINIEELFTERTEAPMSGGMLFHAQAKVLVPSLAELPVVRSDLEKLAADLMVELKLQTP
jgi:glycine cleavage system regulatory protein